MKITNEILSGAAWRLLVALIVAGELALTGACATTASTLPSTAADAAPCTLSTYRIGPGDELNIFVFGEKELSGPVPVRPDGTLSMPLVDRIQASGKTPSELAHAIETKLSEYIRSPKVNVIVTRFVGTLDEQIQVVGQGVTKPVALPYRRGTRVMDVIIQVGGLSQFASLNHARIVRRGSKGHQTDIPVRLGDLLNKGDTRQNKYMCPGDLLVIPETMF